MDLSIKQKTNKREDLTIEVGAERNWLEKTLELKPLVFTYLLAADNWKKSRLEKIYRAVYVLGHMIVCDVNSRMEGGYKGLSMAPVFVRKNIPPQIMTYNSNSNATSQEDAADFNFFQDGLAISCGITFFAKTFESRERTSCLLRQRLVAYFRSITTKSSSTKMVRRQDTRRLLHTST